MQVTQKNSATREEVKNVRSINGLLDELGELTPNEANNLIKSNNCVVRKRAIEYADRQSRLKQLLAEDDSNVEELILSSLGDLTVEEANKLLLEAYSYKVKENAIRYADRQSKLSSLLMETNSNFIDFILSSLGGLTVEEANKLLLEAYSYKVRENVIRYADRQSKLERLLVEEIIADLIFYSLGDISTEEANKLLLEAGDYNVREMAIKYADRQTKLARLLVEETSEVIDPILNSLGELTIEETDKLLKAHTLKVIKYAMLNVCSEGLEELRDVIIEKLKYIKE